MASSRAYHALIHGEHVCRPAAGPQRRRMAAVDFAQQGLWAHDRVLFFTEDPGPDELRQLLTESIPDAAKAIDRLQIIIIPARAAYLDEGSRFDPAALLEGLSAQIDAAISAGYRGLRFDGDVTWIDPSIASIDDLARYELAGNALLLTRPIIGMCHYSPQNFGPTDWARIESAHPEHLPASGVISGIHALWHEPGVLALSGSADLANASAFASLLDAVPPSPALTVDGSHLEFADAHAMGRLLALASRQPTTLRLPAAIAGYLRLLGAEAIPQVQLQTC